MTSQNYCLKLSKYTFLILIAVSAATAILCRLSTQDSAMAAVKQLQTGERYAVLAWNNLGMHCYNRDYSDIGVLPPYNTLWAQVIKLGDPPQVVTTGIKVEYSFPLNTYSAGKPPFPDKTNFWTYAKQLFDVNLPPNVGLAGKSLKGTMDPVGDHFVAEGIPLTEYYDSDARRGINPSKWKQHPYQLALITVRDANTNVLLTKSVVVTPVSSELNCVNCHADTADATTLYPITPTGKVDTNILTLHDYLNPGKYDPPLMQSRPVLCAKCHASAALGAPGLPGVSNLSNAMHRHHKDLPDITPDTQGCYNCHPGPKTRCLRDTMSQNFVFNCTTCHGTMENVSLNPTPWANEPRCDNESCHGSGGAMDKPLYRESKGHGGTYCAGCHDSPHAIAKSREYNDSIKFLMLQKQAGTLRKCTACHLSMPTQPFVHKAKQPPPPAGG
jgi:hypothetical protein